jgi:hypothetical protein
VDCSGVLSDCVEVGCALHARAERRSARKTDDSKRQRMPRCVGVVKDIMILGQPVVFACEDAMLLSSEAADGATQVRLIADGERRVRLSVCNRSSSAGEQITIGDQDEINRSKKARGHLQ